MADIEQKPYDIADKLTPYLKHIRFENTKERWEKLIPGTGNKWTPISHHEACYEVDLVLRTQLKMTGYSMAFLKETVAFLELRLLTV